MKLSASCVLAVLLLLCLGTPSPAHRVTLFAYVDGDVVRVECGFNRSQKVRQGKITVTDALTGASVLEGHTDEHGAFSFRPSEAVLRSGHDVRISVAAGEGHQSDWVVTAKELRSLNGHPAAGEAEQTPAGSGEQEPEAAAGQGVAAQTLAGLSAQELEALVGRVLDAKLAPLKSELAQARDRGPDLRDIIGGLGWILGLLGLAAYMKYRP